MADLLSANALLIGILTILYTLWYAQIQEGIDLVVEKDKIADYRAAYSRYKSVFRWKALPIALGSIALVAINLSDCFDIISFACNQIGSHSPAKYDAARATYVLVTFVMAFLAAHSVKSAWALGVNVRKMTPPRSD